MPASVLTTIEQLRGWLSTSILGVICFVVIRGMALILKHSIDAKELDLKQRQQEREGYGPLIQSMQAEIARIGGQHRECESRMAKLEGELAGYHRQMVMRSSQEITQIPSPMIQAAANRVIDIVSDEQE